MLHAGLVLVRELADRTGLRAGLSARDYLPGLAWFGAPRYDPPRERLSVCFSLSHKRFGVSYCEIRRA